MPDVFLKNAQPIKSRAVLDHYAKFQYQPIDLETYIETWKNWISSNSFCNLQGLNVFESADFVHGTTQAFDHFILRHNHTRVIATLKGEFQYHKCIGKNSKFDLIDLNNLGSIRPDHALIISVPFSGTGGNIDRLDDIFSICNNYKVPVLLDIAYWGISKNTNIDLWKHWCITDVVCSLSKPFYILANHRIGVRFSRTYHDDGISMINETGMQNFHSMSLGKYFMDNFTADFIWKTFGERYNDIVGRNQISATDTIIFATSSAAEYNEYNRGVPGVNRLCVSHLLDEV